jgi:uncharacterized protein (TIGR03083 family)
MEYASFVDRVRENGQRLASVAEGRLAAAVPTCPGWTVRDLVRHVAEVYEHKIASTVLERPPDPWPPDWPADRDPIEWFTDAHGRLLDMFDRSEPTTPSATWWPANQTVGFWARRMAHETAVHRVDAEVAAGTSTPVDADLAVDGIDEILFLMLEGDWSDAPDDAAGGRRVRIETGEKGWLVILERESVAIAADGEEGDAVLQGEPSDVELWLWGRAGDERVTRSGDLDAIRLLRSRLVLATQ